MVVVFIHSRINENSWKIPIVVHYSSKTHLFRYSSTNANSKLKICLMSLSPYDYATSEEKRDDDTLSIAQRYLVNIKSIGHLKSK